MRWTSPYYLEVADFYTMAKMKRILSTLALLSLHLTFLLKFLPKIGEWAYIAPLEVLLLARLFSKKTSRYCHSPGVVGGGGGGVMQKL